MEYRGPFGVIPTKTDGLQVTELLPQLAKRSHLYSVIRSMQTTNGGHPGAGTVGLTGFEENPTVHPNFGSIMSKHRGRSGALPPFFYLGQGIPRDLPRRIEGYGGGTIGKAYDPFLVSCSENGKVGIPTLDLLPGMTPNRIHNRRNLMAQLDDTSRKLDGKGVNGWNQAHHAAYGLLTDPKARDSFDLTTESQSTRDAYGQTSFGQSCLLARRLVETGVPYVQVNWSEYVETFTKYFGMVRCIDDNVGKILRFLEENKLAENTIVVFTSDHGDMMCEHCRMNKGLPYKTSVGIPFVLRYPAKVPAGKVIHTAYTTVDFFPTLMGLMGIKKGLPAFHGLDASGDFTSSPKELSEDRIVYVRHSAGVWVAAFDQRYKLVLSSADKPWLFDLQKDPDELRNFFGREGYQDVTKRLKKELLSQMKEFKEPALAEGKLRHE